MKEMVARQRDVIRNNGHLMDIKQVITVCLAAFFMACNIRSFVNCAGLFPGGATGLTLLIQEALSKFLNVEVPYTLINILINAFPVYIGFRFIGKRFTGLSLLMIVLTGFFADLLPAYHITEDVLLASVFGGCVNGMVLSLVLSADATSGGTDFIAIYLSDKRGTDSFNIVLGINAVILITAGVLFGWDKALYSIIFQYVSTQVLHLFYKKYQRQTLLIVTNHADEVCQAIYDGFHHGATVLDGEGGFERSRRSLVYSVVGANEYPKVVNTIRAIDPGVFINCLDTYRLNGRFYRQPVR